MKLFSTFLCLFLFQQFCSGQIVAEYSWRDGKFTKPFPDSIKEGSDVSIRYIHINRFAFEFNPTTFTPINRDFSDGADKIAAGLGMLAGEENTAAAAEKEATDGATKAKSLKAPNAVAKEKTSDFRKERLTLLHKIAISFQSIQDNIIQINDVMALDGPVKLAWNDAAIFDSITMHNRFFNLVDGVREPADIVKVTRQAVTDINGSLTDINTNLIQLQDLADRFGQQLNAAEVKSNTALISALQKKADELSALYTGANLKTIQDNAVNIYDKTTSLITTNFVSLPKAVGTAEGDYLQVHDELIYNSGKTKFPIDKKLKTYGGSRVDFSVGLSVNIGGNGTEYSLRKNPTDVETGADTATVTLYESRKNKLLLFSPVIMVHWYKTTPHAAQIMLSTGVAPDFSTLADSRIFVGIGVGLPASNNLTRRLVLSAGVSVGYADALKTEYRDWQNYKRFADVNNEDLTTRVVRPGGFFAITYNLGGAGHEAKGNAK